MIVSSIILGLVLIDGGISRLLKLLMPLRNQCRFEKQGNNVDRRKIQQSDDRFGSGG